ncbi:hypothetical protein F4780DRAFT_678559 [Xylariomycetidae sp. FL0641]|nr:hypothetical protein F4780DRAFT_678559 [Xylariomycetidae sp. FL0641]
MRAFSVLSILGFVAFSKAALKITLYEGESCDATDGDGIYFIYDIDDSYADGSCINVEPNASLPSGVTCSQYTDAGVNGPEACTAEATIKSRLFAEREINGVCWACSYYASADCDNANQQEFAELCSPLYETASFKCGVSSDVSVC